MMTSFALGDDPAALYARRFIEELSGEFKRQTQKNAALSLEVPRLKRGRFCRSSESLDILAGARLTIAIVDRTES
ncbi:hypothetical protein [Thiomonas sp. FB-Cd]|jgi:hypothetical protein|uniref:hypothetical protein n=1 Tax=Thiomonas sp. FB-Cd TaxID=1158292 RepID=UPI00068A16F5